jgi:nitrate/nitrite transporter NarK
LSRLDSFTRGSHTVERTHFRKDPSSVLVRICVACLTSFVVAVHYTNFSPLITTLKADLHADSGQAGLFATLLFLGLAAAYIPAGLLADRFGSKPILVGSCALLTLGGILLPLYSNLTWVLMCRTLVGLGSGGAFITGAGVAAGLGKHSSLGQGLYGGATQAGSGLALLITPHLLPLVGWRGSFLFWGLLGIIPTVLWLFVNDDDSQRQKTPVDLGAAVRSPSVWTLGLSHLGTFGLGNAIAAWITIYLIDQFGLSLAAAATIGSMALISGVFFRPLGGILLARKLIGAIPLLRIGTIMGFVGVTLLVLPGRLPALAAIGIAAIAIGSTMPYASVFNSAAKLRGVGKGAAQGFVSVLSSPTVIIGPTLIGYILDKTGSFSLAFSVILLFGIIAVAASFLAGPAVKRETIA